MKQTFRDRLQLLMKEDRPYTWARKVGIEKGLFQYYWQKGKIPTYENLLKIQNFSGCSLDWLLTGKAVDINQLENLPMLKETTPVYGEMNIKRARALEDVKSIYASRSERDIDLLEGVLERIILSKGKKRSVAKGK